jgi:hypothetical protein
MLGSIVTAFVGTWLTPTVILWRKARNQVRRLGYYHNQICNLYGDGKLNIKDVGELDNLRNIVTIDYTIGKINKEQFDELKDDISIKYRELFMNELNSLQGLSENNITNQLDKIKEYVDDAHGGGKINSEQFAEIKKEISLQYLDLYKKRIDSLHFISGKEKENQSRKIKDNITDAYSKDKINDLHYELLKENISHYKIA